MPNAILPKHGNENPGVVEQLLSRYALALADFQCRMTPSAADAYLGIKKNTVRGAIERREIEYIKAGSQYRVTPMALAKWVEDYLTVKPKPLAG